MAKETPSNVVNLLCEGTMVEGDIKTKNDIRIDGAVKGRIITSSRLVLGNSANIEGNIECVNVDVMGTVNGDILGTGTVALKVPAKVKGNIVAGVISIEPGVVFDGTCQMLNKEGQHKKEA